MLCFLLMRIKIHSVALEILSFKCRKSFALVLPINTKFNEDLLFFFFLPLILVVPKILLKIMSLF